MSNTDPGSISVPETFRWPSWPRMWRVLGGIIVLLALAVSTYTIYYLTRHADGEELYLFTAQSYLPDQPAEILLTAYDNALYKKLANHRVTVTVEDVTGKPVHTWTTKTDAYGQQMLKLPSLPEGAYRLTVRGRAVQVTAPLSVSSPAVALAGATDKAVYHPGETIRMQAWRYSQLNLARLPAQPVRIEMIDPTSKTISSELFPAAAVTEKRLGIPLSPQAVPGIYALKVYSGAKTAEATVSVQPITPAVTFDRAWFQPEQPITGVVTAAPGRRVELTMEILTAQWRTVYYRYYSSPERRSAGETFCERARVSGTADAVGHYRFQLMFPKDHTDLIERDHRFVARLKVTAAGAPAGQNRIEVPLPVTQTPLLVQLQLDANAPEWNFPTPAWLYASRPDGSPVADVVFRFGKQTLRSGPDGLANLTLPPNFTLENAVLGATDPAGNSITRTLSHEMPCSEDSSDLIIRPDRTVYTPGQVMNVEFIHSWMPYPMYYQMTVHGIPVMTGRMDEQPLPPGKAISCRIQKAIPLPPGLIGTLQLHAYQVFGGGKIFHFGRLIQVNPTDRSADTLTFVRSALVLPDQTRGMSRLAALLVPATELTPEQQQEAKFLLINQFEPLFWTTNASPSFYDRKNILQAQQKYYLEVFTESLLGFLIALAMGGPLLAVWREPHSPPARLVVATPMAWESVQSQLERMRRRTALFPWSLLFLLIGFWLRERMRNLLLIDWLLPLTITIAVIVVVLNLLVMLLLFRAAGRIRRQLLPETTVCAAVQLRMIPWLYGDWALLAILFAVVGFLPRCQPCWSLMLIAMVAALMIPALARRLSRIVSCTPATEGEADRAGMGCGLGGRRASRWFWVMAFVAYGLPIALAYCLALLAVLAMFLPLIKIIECLGG